MCFDHQIGHPYRLKLPEVRLCASYIRLGAPRLMTPPSDWRLSEDRGWCHPIKTMGSLKIRTGAPSFCNSLLLLGPRPCPREGDLLW